MNRLTIAFGALAFAVGLAACGGGGSSGGGGGTLPTSPPVPTPQSAVYTGTETIANAYTGYPCGQACGDPQVTPYPNNTVTYSLRNTVTTTAGSGTVSSAETVTEPNQTLTDTLTTLVTPSPNAAVTNTTVTKTTYSDSDGYTQVVTYPVGAGLIVDQTPENNNATWTNTAQKTTAETYSDGTSINRTTNANGSYAETEVNNNSGVNDIATVNNDASASWNAVANSYGFLGGYFTGYALSVPSGGNVTFTATIYNGSTETLTEPQFFSTSPLVLASNTSTITTGVSFPGSCSVPAGYGTSGDDIHSVVTQVDPLFGFGETTTTDAYVSSTYGLVCARSVDVLDTYYDWNLDEYYFIYVNSTPLIETTTTSTLTLQSGNGIGVASSSSQQTTQSSTAQGAAVIAQALVRGEAIRQRAKAEQRVLTSISAHGPKGGRRL